MLESHPEISTFHQQIERTKIHTIEGDLKLSPWIEIHVSLLPILTAQLPLILPLFKRRCIIRENELQYLLGRITGIYYQTCLDCGKIYFYLAK